MPNRYLNPPEPPNPALIKAYLRDAQPTAEDVRIDEAAAVDARRVKAVRTLHTLWRQWNAEKAKVCAAVFTAEFTLELEEMTAEATRSLVSGERDLSEAVAAVAAKMDESDSRENAAYRALREHWITKLGAPDCFDFMLQNFFDRNLRVIRDSPDPLAAMRVFWEGTPRRGRQKETNVERDRSLAVAVQKWINAGEGPEDAIEAVAKESPAIAAVEKPLSYESIYKIYYRVSLEARLALASWTTEEKPKLRKGRKQKASCPTDVEQ
jgi:hypothetical protein